MAHIDNLISSIKDEKLRDALRSEYDRVTQNRKLGLVFDRHLPESVVLPNLTIRTGDKVSVTLNPVVEAAAKQPELETTTPGFRPDPTKLDGTGVWTVINWAVEPVETTTNSPAVEAAAQQPGLETTTEPIALLRDGEGNTREVPRSLLVPTKEFGDPIYPGLVSTGKVERGSKDPVVEPVETTSVQADYSGTRNHPEPPEDGNRPYHTVINGENYHALEALLFAYEGKIDAIYIDPPYNTGAKDWKYNNDYVDGNDAYAHSKWLSFMEKRLLLAKRLLNPANSVLIVTIDENEYPRLLLLLEEIFKAAKMTTTAVTINPKSTPENGFGRVDEYVIYIAIGRAHPARVVDPGLGPEPSLGNRSVRWRGLTRTGANGVRSKSPGAYYPIFINLSDGSIHGSGAVPEDHDDGSGVIAPDGTVAVWPTPRPSGAHGRWSVVKDTFDALLSIGAVKTGHVDFARQSFPLYYLTDADLANIDAGVIAVIGREPTGSLIVEYSHETPKTTVSRTIWHRTAHSASEHGTGLISRLLPGVTFDFAKSLYAVEDELRLFIGDNPEAVVLDFFAGSGTTAHAVMRLNRQDGGRRRAILVTNNEVSVDEAKRLREAGYRPGDPEWESLGICEYITKPRIKAAITGHTPPPAVEAAAKQPGLETPDIGPVISTGSTTKIAASSSEVPLGEPIKGDYKFTDIFPMAEGFHENAEFFTLTYEDPALVQLGRDFTRIAPLLWLKAGAVGERIEQVAEQGWALPERAAYGVLFDATEWGPFVDAVAKRLSGLDDSGRLRPVAEQSGTRNLPDSADEVVSTGSTTGIPLTHIFIVTDSLTEYQAVVSKLDPSLITTRLYADYLRTFEINKDEPSGTR